MLCFKTVASAVTSVEPVALESASLPDRIAGAQLEALRKLFGAPDNHPIPDSIKLDDGQTHPLRVTRSAVAVLLAKHNHRWYFFSTVRARHISHPWRQAFPGGAQEDQDGGDPRLTAIRESSEECDLDLSAAHYLGALPYRLSAPVIKPGVAYITQRLIEPHVFVLNGDLDAVRVSSDKIFTNHADAEIEEAFWVPFAELYRRGMVDNDLEFSHLQYVDHRLALFAFDQGSVIRADHLREPVLPGPNYVIWGITGRLVHEILNTLCPFFSDIFQSVVELPVTAPFYVARLGKATPVHTGQPPLTMKILAHAEADPLLIY